MLPTGFIVIWRGAIIDIPAGWVLCNGENASPDLRDKFVIGAGDAFAVDDEGGSLQHNHTFTGDGHSHNIPAGTGIDSGFARDASTDSTAVTGTTGVASSIPPFYALAYIMKT